MMALFYDCLTAWVPLLIFITKIYYYNLLRCLNRRQGMYVGSDLVLLSYADFLLLFKLKNCYIVLVIAVG